MTKRPVPPALRRFLYLRRRSLAALCAFLAVLATLLALAPTTPSTTTVYAARSALPAGTVLGADHVAPLALPADAVPEGAALTEGDLLGRTLAGPVSNRSVLTAASVSEGSRLARPGHVVVALPLSDGAMAGLVGPGSRIDVLDGGGAALATDVQVIAPPDTPGGNTFDLGGASRSLLVEVPEAVAGKLASQGLTSVTITLR